mgnify:CR=1 FL=1
MGRNILDVIAQQLLNSIYHLALNTGYVGYQSSRAYEMLIFLYPAYKCLGVECEDDQLSLAIGKEGQNARLAARLTGYKIDIKPASQAEEV